MRKPIITLVVLAVALSGANAAVRAQTPAPNVYRSLEAGKPVHAAGELRGRIVSVDYPSGMLVINEGARNQTVAVVPSTTIYRHGKDATVSDLRTGEHVTISAYEVSGRLVAQTIRI